jgi:hypothetical protein
MTNRKTAYPGRLAGRVTLILMVVLVCACSSSAHSTATATATATASASTTAIENACEQVSAVLSDGPDPDADPVGYAEAQILPLRQISVSNQALHGVISQLADAYQKFFASNGKSSNAKEDVAVASKTLNSICPGAAS